jgi:hypothetical protein
MKSPYLLTRNEMQRCAQIAKTINSDFDRAEVFGGAELNLDLAKRARGRRAAMWRREWLIKATALVETGDSEFLRSEFRLFRRNSIEINRFRMSLRLAA